jgi:predicted RNase H-like nuclease (RuvC/YqgF family)
LGDLQIRVSILKGNRRSLKQKVENLQAQAANMERAGMTVNVARLRGIEQMQSEIAATDRAVIDREREIAHLEADFQADIDRFGMLQDVVEMRRTLRSRNTRKP